MTSNDYQNVNPTLELSEAEMKRIGYEAVDMMVAHFASLHQQAPVRKADSTAMDLLLQESMPEQGSNPTNILQHVRDNIFANSALTTHPRYYSFVPSPSNFISAIADGLASAYNLFSGAWTSSPGAAKLEMVTINWMLKLFGFPVREGGGLFVSGGSAANLMGLSVARNVKLGDDMANAMIYFSDQTHSSVDRALLVLGFRKDQIKRIPCNERFQLPIQILRETIQGDIAAGKRPFCVVANAGTTNTGAVDPLPDVSILCRQFKLWMHVDAAYGGGAVLCEQGRLALNGIEMADSVTVDPHKWFFQPYEIGCLLVRNHEWMSGTFRMTPEYLKDLEGSAEEINFYDYGIQLTRGFRALKFYMSVKAFGLASFREAVRHGFQMAEWTEQRLRQSPHWEIVSPANLAVLNFRYNPQDRHLDEEALNALNQYISVRIIEEEAAMLTTTVLRGKNVLRMCLINPRSLETELEDTILRLEAYAHAYLS